MRTAAVIGLIGFGLLRSNAALTETPELVAPAFDRPWQISSYADEAGLAHQRIFDITFETNGTAWLAAGDGLRRFDGYTWQRFDTNSGLPSQFIRSVLVTRDGSLWVGSDAGAGVFDPERQTYDSQGSETGLASRNVRRIVEDPDGTLWFCCDQWPDTAGGKGGLTSLYQGRWETHDRSNGLPLDYVVSYFRASSGHQYATTPRGWVQRLGDRWSVPLNAGYDNEESVLQMAEDADGTLFAQGEHGLLALANDGRWETLNTPTALVGATREREAIAVEWNGTRGILRFDIWDGRKFVPASSPVSCKPRSRLYDLEQAPDGAIWCVGYGTVVRWAFRTGQWEFYPRLPLPAALDSRGRLWFSSGSNVVVRQAGALQPLPQLRQFHSVDRDGSALAVQARKGELVFTSPDRPDLSQPVSCGINLVAQVVTDAAGSLWVMGYGRDHAPIIARKEGQQWVTISSPGLRDKRFLSASADAEKGIWIVARPKEKLDYELAHVVGDEIEWMTFTGGLPPLTYANFLAASGQQWIYGFAGLYRLSPEPSNSWQRVTAFPETGFEQFVSTPNELLVLFSGGHMGRSGCALYREATWTVEYGNFDRIAVGSDKQTFLLAARSGVYFRRNPGTLDMDFLPLPADALVGDLVQDRDGTLWIGTADGVFHYLPGRVPPRTRIDAATADVRPGAPLPVLFSGVKRFGTDHPSNAFRYSWRFDDGDWCSFQRWSSNLLSVPPLEPGAHRLEARACDPDGNIDPAQATFKFTVLAVPLQQRAWFKPLVIVVAALIAYLSWIGITRTRQIARSNTALREEIAIRRRAEAELQQARDGLEQRVTERTAELSTANRSLSHEIEERRQAEQAQRKLEEQLRQAHKMEAIGTLAGGIAHDFNNILAIIIPYTHLALEDDGDNLPVREHLRQILQAADRAKNLVQQLLAFSRQQPQERQVVNLEPIIKETLKLLRSILPSTIEMVQRIDPVPPTLADPTQIHQVVMNLCTNAQHAVNGGPGRLEIEFGLAELDEARARRHPDLHPGQYVRLCVRDDGCGMSSELMGRIFEPFFTTKGLGQGTGLGLSIVHGIVKDHGGAILVDSQPAQGTEVQIFLPVVQEGIPAAAPEEGRKVTGSGDGEHILIVDDEPAVLTAITETLSRAGYNVSSRTDPSVALEDMRANPKDYDLLFTDLTMPGMNGVELARRTKEIRPDLPVLLATGYGGDSVLSQRANTNILKVVEKPLRPSLIANVVREVLGKGKA